MQESAFNDHPPLKCFKVSNTGSRKNILRINRLCFIYLSGNIQYQTAIFYIDVTNATENVILVLVHLMTLKVVSKIM